MPRWAASRCCSASSQATKALGWRRYNSCRRSLTQAANALLPSRWKARPAVQIRSSTCRTSSVKIAPANSARRFCSSPLAPSISTCTSRLRLGGKPRRVASARPSRGGQPARKSSPHLLVDRAMQQAIGAPTQRVHHDHHRFLAVLALVAFLGSPLGSLFCPLLLAAMPLTTVRTTSPWTPSFRQLRLGRRRRALAVRLDDQHPAVPLAFVLLPPPLAVIDIRAGITTQPHDQGVQRLRGRRPTPGVPHDYLNRLVTHAGRQPRQQRNRGRRKTITRQA